MNSHKYAEKLRQLADVLLSKPEFNTPWEESLAYTTFYYWGDKSDFLGAVKALGAGKKDWCKGELIFLPEATDMLRFGISRSTVCRKVQEEKWECEPLLSDEEEAKIGA